MKNTSVLHICDSDSNAGVRVAEKKKKKAPCFTALLQPREGVEGVAVFPQQKL